MFKRKGLRTQTLKYFSMSYGEILALFQSFGKMSSSKYLQKGDLQNMRPKCTIGPNNIFRLKHFSKFLVPIQSNSIFTCWIIHLWLEISLKYGATNIILHLKAKKPPSYIERFRSEKGNIKIMGRILSACKQYLTILYIPFMKQQII